MLPSEGFEEGGLSGIGWANDCPMLMLRLGPGFRGKRPGQAREHGMIWGGILMGGGGMSSVESAIFDLD